MNYNFSAAFRRMISSTRLSEHHKSFFQHLRLFDFNYHNKNITVLQYV